MNEKINVSKLIAPIVDENGQTKLDFKSSEKLFEFLSEINKKYPLIGHIIKDRISYDGINFYIDKFKMTQDEIWLKMKEIDKYERREKNKDNIFKKEDGITDEDNGGYQYSWQEINNR